LLVASGATGAYGIAAIYAVDTGELITEFVGHRDILYSAVWSPEESLVATAGYDREIILWNARTGDPLRTLHGHNGAIFDLAFSPDGKVIVSGCADETVKVWNVQSGQRLDTLSQNEGEVLAVEVTSDGKYIVAASADNRLRVWSLMSTDKPRINPLVATRFVDESGLVNFQIAPDGKSLVVLSESGNVKVIRTSDWSQAATLEALGETASDLAIRPDSRAVSISLMNGEVADRDLPKISEAESQSARAVEPIYLDLGDPQQFEESKLRRQQGDGIVDVGRGVEVSGQIAAQGESDFYQWTAHEGEVWAIDADALDKSQIDPIVTILDSDSQPVLRTRLQAVRESYFTFRGKDSKQISDFRLFNWERMNLNEYLYAAGEVTRLFIHPRGPDSGFNVYPGEDSRWTYFGTSHRAHALGEPAYIVRPLGGDETPTANGLPVFDLYYENDDDPMRKTGTNSRMLFTAPLNNQYTVRIADARGDGGSEFGYKLAIRAASPRFRPYFNQPKSPILKGTGREFHVRVDRFDGFTGPVTFEIFDLPAGLDSNSPVTIEGGQRFATANIWAAESIEGWEGELSARLVARASVNGRHVERQVGEIKKLKIGDRPGAIPSVHPIGREVPENEPWTLQVRRGETASARILVRRKEGFNNEIQFGKEDAGRNATHGVYVDNIGLSGLLVRAGETEREFFLTADPISKPGKRMFHLRGQVDGNVTSHPIVVEVLP
jgi:WD40 repeat protein